MLNPLIKKLKFIRIRALSWVRGNYLRALGAQVGKNVTFGGAIYTRFNGDPSRVRIGDNVVFAGEIDLRNRENGTIDIGDNCFFDNGLRLVAAREATIQFHEGVSAGMQLVINAGGNVTVGRHSLFSSYVHINGSAHPTFRDDLLINQGYIQGTVTIEEDCWLANCVNVLMDSVLHRGVIVSANSVVSGTFDAYSVVAGVPARKIGVRLYRDPARNVAERAKNETAMGMAAKGFGRTQTSIPREEAHDQIKTVFSALFPRIAPPQQDAPIRGNGVLNSLEWLEFVEGICEKFAVPLSDDLITAPWFDSFDVIVETICRPSPDNGQAGQDDESRIDLATHDGFQVANKPFALYPHFLEFAEKHPDKPALVLCDNAGERKYTYAELHDSAARYAQYLADQNFGPGDHVALVMPLSIDLLAAFWGCLHLGAIPSIHAYPSNKVPLDLYARNHAQMFACMNLHGLCCPQDLLHVLKPLMPVEAKSFVIGDWRNCKPKAEAHSPALHEVAVIQHSSGSTGVQKGVALSHQAISSQLISYADAIGLNNKDVIFSWLPLYHDMGFISSFLMPFMTGVPLVLMSPFDWVAKPEVMFSLSRRYRATLAWMPNFAFNLFAERHGSRRDVEVSSFRMLISCSEPVSASTMIAFETAFKDGGLGDGVLRCCYAMAENTFAVTQSAGLKTISICQETLARERVAKEVAVGRLLVSQGKPIAGTALRIVGEEFEELPNGRVGEIQIKSNCMLDGYYNNPAASERALRQGWFLTGDLGFLHDGELYITGRKKDLIITGGRNFYPQDIEEIVTSIEGVKSGRVSAFGIFNDHRGTEDVIVMLETVDAQDGNRQGFLVSDVKKRVFETLDCVIHDVVILPPGGIAKTSSGKVARSTCREQYIALLGNLK